MSFLKNYLAASERNKAELAKAARREAHHNPARATFIREELGVRLPESMTVVSAAYKRFEAFLRGGDMAHDELGAAGLKRFLATQSYLSRGHSKAKRFTSHVALTRVRKSKYTPHQGKRECARRFAQQGLSYV